MTGRASRTQTLRQRIETAHGTFHGHVEYDAAGRVCAVALSVPGKTSETPLGDTLAQVTESLAGLVAQVVALCDDGSIDEEHA